MAYAVCFNEINVARDTYLKYVLPVNPLKTEIQSVMRQKVQSKEQRTAQGISDGEESALSFSK